MHGKWNRDFSKIGIIQKTGDLEKSEGKLQRLTEEGKVGETTQFELSGGSRNRFDHVQLLISTFRSSVLCPVIPFRER